MSTITTALPSAVEVSAPGKLILAGEHAAVYGRPALVAAASARLVVRAGVDASGERGVLLELADLGVRERVSGEALRAYARGARERWQAFAADPTPERFRLLRGADPAHLAKVALGETLECYGAGFEPAWTVRLESAIPVGAGMGSSAAASVALVTAALRLLGHDGGPEEVEPIALEVERRQHGSPSGVDTAIVLRGGVQWVERGADGALRFEALPAELPLLAELRVLDTGAPEQATGEVVAAVRQRREEDRDGFERVLDGLEAAARALREALVAGDGPRVAEALASAERGLERLGVVPAAVRELVRRIEGTGGAAKVSGAGALVGRGAGCVVVYHPHPATLEYRDLVAPATVLPVRLGAEGIRTRA